MLTRYFALMPTGNFYLIGLFPDDEVEAFESDKGQEAIWVLDESTGREWISQLEAPVEKEVKPRKGEAYVICCNDSVEAVVLNDKSRAEEKMELLAQAHYNRNPGNWESYESYRQLCYWHLHDVEYE